MKMVLLCYVACKNEEEARKIGKALVEERLAACANIVPSVKSIFRWKGKVGECGEALLLVKTAAEKKKKVEARVKQLHSYDVPCICFYEGVASKEYEEWVAEETG